MNERRTKSDSEALVPAGEMITRALAAYQVQAAAAPRVSEQQEDGTIPLAHYLWVMRRYRWHMLTFVAVCTIAAFIISLRMRPIYESIATLDVDRDTPTTVVGDDSRPGSNNFDSDEYMATQMELIQSDSVLRPVALKYNLMAAEPAGGLHGFLNSILHRGKPLSANGEVPQGPMTLPGLKITRPPPTYLIRIAYRSPDPVLAAHVANAVADSYLQHTFEIRAHSSASLAQFMERQLDELRAKMERSGMALAQFEKEMNVINPEEKTNILSARLLQLNTEYTNAQADRMKKEAEYNSTQSGSMDAAQVSTQGEALKRLQDRVSEASEKFAQVKEQYGPNHPEYAKAAGQLHEVQSQLDTARLSVRRRTEVEYREALNREAMLRQSVNEIKGEYDQINAHSFQYENLKREADGDKKLYDELVRKIKEASINSGFQSRTVRLADGALPGDTPVLPNIPLNVLLAFVLSGLLAIGGAVLADTLDNTISDPEQVVRELRTTMIGSLPMVRDWKFRFGPVESNGGGELVKVQDETISTSTKLLEESVRVLHSSILLSDLDRRTRSILVTSASPRDGKSTTSVLLATTHAQQGKKTLLIDGDMRRPSVDRFFGMDNLMGLSNVVLGEAAWRDAIVPAERIPNLDVLTSGPPSHRALEMSGAGLERVLEEAGREYSLIIIDSAPFMNFAEPLEMSTMVDGVVVVSVAGETNRKALASVLGRLQRLRANVIGLVLNKVTKEMSENYGYYGYGKYASNYYYVGDRKK
jgi:capsular exopolysaccharide synthesis family protein